MTEKEMPKIPEANYTCTLTEIEGRVSRIRGNNYLALTMQVKDEEYRNTVLICYIFGSWDNLIAWKRLLKQDFTVRVRYKESPDQTAIYLDARIRPDEKTEPK